MVPQAWNKQIPQQQAPSPLSTPTLLSTFNSPPFDHAQKYIQATICVIYMIDIGITPSYPCHIPIKHTIVQPPAYTPTSKLHPRPPPPPPFPIHQQMVTGHLQNVCGRLQQKAGYDISLARWMADHTQYGTSSGRLSWATVCLPEPRPPLTMPLILQEIQHMPHKRPTLWSKLLIIEESNCIFFWPFTNSGAVMSTLRSWRVAIHKIMGDRIRNYILELSPARCPQGKLRLLKYQPQENSSPRAGRWGLGWEAPFIRLCHID